MNMPTSIRMTTTYKGLLAILLLFTLAPLSAQQYLDINTSHKCIFHGTEMDEELYSFPTDVDVMDRLVATILKDGGELEKNFTIIQTNVVNVTAVVDGNKRYLLWSQDFIAQASTIEAFASVAHAVAHLVNEHTFRPENAKAEAQEADFFMGYILALAGNDKNQVLSYLQKLNHKATCQHSFNNYKDVLRGHKKGDDYLKLKQFGPYDNDPSLLAFQKAAFPFPPPECHTSHEFPNSSFSDCFSLGQVAHKIKQRLDAKDYPSKFMSVPNGFAIVSQLEQYNTDGSIMHGLANRWTAIPPHESFSLSWNYFKSLIYPRRGHLRLFVFIITNQNYSSDKKMVSRKDATAWFSQAINRLPKQIASESFNSDYSVSALVYEFEVPESNHRAKQSCPTRYQAKEHLRLSGLLQGL